MVYASFNFYKSFCRYNTYVLVRHCMFSHNSRSVGDDEKFFVTCSICYLLGFQISIIIRVCPTDLEIDNSIALRRKRTSKYTR